MSGNPINRLAALLGLVALTPIAYGVATGTLDMVDAAVRAGITLVAVVLVRIIGRIGLSALANSMDRQPVAATSPLVGPSISRSWWCGPRVGPASHRRPTGARPASWISTTATTPRDGPMPWLSGRTILPVSTCSTARQPATAGHGRRR